MSLLVNFDFYWFLTPGIGPSYRTMPCRLSQVPQILLFCNSNFAEPPGRAPSGRCYDVQMASVDSLLKNKH